MPRGALARGAIVNSSADRVGRTRPPRSCPYIDPKLGRFREPAVGKQTAVGGADVAGLCGGHPRMLVAPVTAPWRASVEGESGPSAHDSMATRRRRAQVNGERPTLLERSA